MWYYSCPVQPLTASERYLLLKVTQPNEGFFVFLAPQTMNSPIGLSQLCAPFATGQLNPPVILPWRHQDLHLILGWSPVNSPDFSHTEQLSLNQYAARRAGGGRKTETELHRKSDLREREGRRHGGKREGRTDKGRRANPVGEGSGRGWGGWWSDGVYSSSGVWNRCCSVESEGPVVLVERLERAEAESIHTHTHTQKSVCVCV